MLKYEEPALIDACGILVAYTNTAYKYAQSILVDRALRNIIYQFDKANNGTLNINVEVLFDSLGIPWTFSERAIITSRYINFECIDTYDLDFDEFIKIFTMNEYMESLIITKITNPDIRYFIALGVHAVEKCYYSYQKAKLNGDRINEIYALGHYQKLLEGLSTLSKLTGRIIDIPEEYVINRKKG